MDKEHIQYLATALSQRGVSFETGLSDSELKHLETTLGFTFLPDLHAFLRHALPVSKGFPLWRQPSLEDVRSRLSWPADGICFDIENNAYWGADWGAKPANLRDAFAVARAKLAAAPVLIPIYSHRYIPSSPAEAGNPVYSVYQTDIIYYGFDLIDHLSTEFGFPRPPAYFRPIEPKKIAFWSNLVS